MEREAAAAAAAGRPPLEFDCRELLYQEFPLQMTWNRTFRRWNRRKRGVSDTIGRIYFVDSSDDEKFYLRLLLTIMKDSTFFDDLCIFDNVHYDIFKSACIAHELLDSDEQ